MLFLDELVKKLAVRKGRSGNVENEMLCAYKKMKVF